MTGGEAQVSEEGEGGSSNQKSFMPRLGMSLRKRGFFLRKSGYQTDEFAHPARAFATGRNQVSAGARVSSLAASDIV